jgi:hypothetical protein
VVRYAGNKEGSSSASPPAKAQRGQYSTSLAEKLCECGWIAIRFFVFIAFYIRLILK